MLLRCIVQWIGCSYNISKEWDIYRCWCFLLCDLEWCRLSGKPQNCKRECKQKEIQKTSSHATLTSHTTLKCGDPKIVIRINSQLSFSHLSHCCKRGQISSDLLWSWLSPTSPGNICLKLLKVSVLIFDVTLADDSTVHTAKLLE